MKNLKAVIFDFNTRRAGDFSKVLNSAGWQCDHFLQVYENGNLRNLGNHNLIMLHLRGPADKNGTSGNVKSWEFLQTIAKSFNTIDVCLIAYTGGEAPKPEKFKQFEEKWPWVYVPRVNNPQDIHLKEFAEAWIMNPGGKPPLHIVCPPLQQVEVNTQITALKFLILGYQSAHPCCIGNDTSCHGNDNSTEALHTWTESPDCWLPVLGEDMSGAQALIEALDNHDLKNLVSKLAEFFNSSNKTNVFPHAALCTFSSGNKSAA